MKIERITCVICGEEVSEEKYPDHMSKVHSGMSQLDALKQQKEIEQNIPKPLEVPLDKEAPPPPEFEEIAKLIDNPPKKEEPVTPTVPIVVKPSEPTPLELKYVWIGKCPTCNTDVRTIKTRIVTNANNRWFITAYCLTHGELEQQEVTPLDEKRFTVIPKDTIPVGELGYLIKKEVEDGGKPVISKKTRV